MYQRESVEGTAAVTAVISTLSLCVTTLFHLIPKFWVYSQNDQEHFVPNMVDVSVLMSISSFTFLGQVSYVDIGQPRVLGQFLS